MKKRVLSILLCASMTAGSLAGCAGKTNEIGETTGKEEHVTEASTAKGETSGAQITLFCDDAATQENFQDYVDAAERSTGLKIEVLAMPTNTDDRTAKVCLLYTSDAADE